MSIKPVPCFTVVCDWHGCDADMFADSEYSGGDMDLVAAVIEDRTCDGWLEGRDGTSHYCDKHPAAWASIGEFPPRPFLLIHDGDTGDCDDDGRVTYLTPELEDPRQPSILDLIEGSA